MLRILSQNIASKVRHRFEHAMAIYIVKILGMLPRGQTVF